jgi:hypothetical protein
MSSKKALCCPLFLLRISPPVLPIVVLGAGLWTLIKPQVAQVVAAVNTATSGSFAEVEIPYE